ncbi:MAG: hypothetical protein ACYTE8_11610 [Planctomycetota bacterium]
MNTSKTPDCAFQIFFKNLRKITSPAPNIYMGVQRGQKTAATELNAYYGNKT